MAILNVFAGSGGGVRIPLEAPTAFSLAPQDGKFLLTWTDPVDKVATPGGEAVATWNYTIVIRKIGSVPQTPTDGIEILREHTRNQYQSTAYVDDLYIENGITYYYAVFAVSTIGVLSEPATANGEPMPASPEFLKGEELDYDTQNGHSVAYSQNHAILFSGERFKTQTTISSNLTKGSLAEYYVDGYANAVPGHFNGYAVFLVIDSNLPYLRTYSPSLTASMRSISNRTDSSSLIGLGCSATHMLTIGGEDTPTMVNGYNTSFTRVTPESVTNDNWGRGGQDMSGTSVGEYVLFAGGYASSSLKAVAYSSTLTKIEGLTGLYQQNSFLSPGGDYAATASTGNFAYFAGIQHPNSSDQNNKVTAYNTGLTRQPQLTLSKANNYPVSGFTSIDGYAMFAFEYGGSRTVNVFDNALTRMLVTDVSGASLRTLSRGGGTVGQYAIFHSGSSNTSNIYIFQCV